MKNNSSLSVSAISLFGLEGLQRRGRRSLPDLMHEVGLPLAALKKPNMFVPFASNIRLLELAAREWDRPNLGLEWVISLPKSIPTLGPAMFLARYFDSMDQLIVAGFEYLNSQTNAFEINLVRGLENARIGYEVNTFYWPGRQIIEHSIAGICVAIRAISNDANLSPIEVHFTHSRPQTDYYEELLANIFRCPVHFDCSENQLIYPIGIFEITPPRKIGTFRYILKSHIQKRIEKLDGLKVSFVDNVEQAIQSLLGINQISLETIAELLDIAPKTMQRMLSAEGKTFSDILEKVRISSAKRMLVDTNMRIVQIAKCLDYSSNPAFTLAFKRWEGLSPTQYRKANAKVGFN